MTTPTTAPPSGDIADRAPAGPWSSRIHVELGPGEVTVTGTRFEGDPPEIRQALKDKRHRFRWEKGREPQAWVYDRDPARLRDAADAIRQVLADLDRRAAAQGTAEPRTKPAKRFPPTPQQQAIIDAVLAGGDVAVLALAGTGKTTTMRLVAEALPDKKITYIAFNRAIAEEAAEAMPRNVTAMTSHAMAKRALSGGPLARKLSHIGKGARGPKEIASILKITRPATVGGEVYTPEDLARLAMATVHDYRTSAADHIIPENLPLAVQQNTLLAPLVLRYAQDAWEDICSPDGKIVFEHDDYRKIWIESRPILNTDLIIFDEAQDINPVLAKLVQRQPTQTIVVGDSYQSIYGFTGAVDALRDWPADVVLPLTQSWRFGPEVAAVGNAFLRLLGTTMELQGNPALDTRLGRVDDPDAVLCRTNAGAVAAVIQAFDNGKKVALVGGGKEIKDIANAAKDLQNGRGTKHPELSQFADWDEVVHTAENDPDARSLLTFVRLIERYSPDGLIRTIADLVPETSANPDNQPDVVVSTAHKAKGREWDNVRIGADFYGPTLDEETGEVILPPPEELRLSYVTVTRAKQVLEIGSLDWIEDPAAAAAMAAGKDLTATQAKTPVLAVATRPQEPQGAVPVAERPVASAIDQTDHDLPSPAPLPDPGPKLPPAPQTLFEPDTVGEDTPAEQEPDQQPVVPADAELPEVEAAPLDPQDGSAAQAEAAAEPPPPEVSPPPQPAAAQETRPESSTAASSQISAPGLDAQEPGRDRGPVVEREPDRQDRMVVLADPAGLDQHDLTAGLRQIGADDVAIAATQVFTVIDAGTGQLSGADRVRAAAAFRSLHQAVDRAYSQVPTELSGGGAWLLEVDQELTRRAAQAGYSSYSSFDRPPLADREQADASVDVGQSAGDAAPLGPQTQADAEPPPPEVSLASPSPSPQPAATQETRPEPSTTASPHVPAPAPGLDAREPDREDRVEDHTAARPLAPQPGPSQQDQQPGVLDAPSDAELQQGFEDLLALLAEHTDRAPDGEDPVPAGAYGSAAAERSARAFTQLRQCLAGDHHDIITAINTAAAREHDPNAQPAALPVLPLDLEPLHPALRAAHAQSGWYDDAPQWQQVKAVIAALGDLRDAITAAPGGYLGEVARDVRARGFMRAVTARVSRLIAQACQAVAVGMEKAGMFGTRGWLAMHTLHTRAADFADQLMGHLPPGWTLETLDGLRQTWGTLRARLSRNHPPVQESTTGQAAAGTPVTGSDIAGLRAAVSAGARAAGDRVAESRAWQRLSDIWDSALPVLDQIRQGVVRFENDAQTLGLLQTAWARTCELASVTARQGMDRLEAGDPKRHGPGWHALRLLRHVAEQNIAHLRGEVPRDQQVPLGTYDERAAGRGGVPATAMEQVGHAERPIAPPAVAAAPDGRPRADGAESSPGHAAATSAVIASPWARPVDPSVTAAPDGRPRADGAESSPGHAAATSAVIASPWPVNRQMDVARTNVAAAASSSPSSPPGAGPAATPTGTEIER